MGFEPRHSSELRAGPERLWGGLEKAMGRARVSLRLSPWEGLKQVSWGKSGEAQGLRGGFEGARSGTLKAT